MKEFIPQKLTDDEDQESETRVKRVKVEVVDFDWIFKEDNAKNLMILLTQQDNTKIFVQRSINIFISFMWEFYQKAIIKFVFVPYIFYMAFFVVLATKQSGSFIQELEKNHVKKMAAIALNKTQSTNTTS